MRKVERLPTRDYGAGHGPELNASFAAHSIASVAKLWIRYPIMGLPF